MREKLEKLLENSKSKYFNYPVSAILECNDKTLFKGVNVETSSPEAGSCAERVAIFSAIANGYDKKDFKRLHIMAKSNKCIYPCFICRQALIDYCPLDMEIYTYYGDNIEKTTVLDLVPYSFSDSDLEK